MRSLLRASVAVAALVALTACSSSPDTSTRTTPSASPPAERTFVLDGEPMLACGAATGAVCGRLGVPEDRSDPSGRTIELSVSVVPAADPNPEPDPVFFLAGGPGGAATQSWSSAPMVFPGIHAHHDIVLVDQRGTGDSNLLLWPELPDVSDLSRAQLREALIPWAREAIAGLGADPRFYSSPQAADDLDDVRAALGYDRIDLYGGSYGATLAQYYLRQHEEHVRAVVLDGGTLLDVPILELIPKSSQEALDSVFARCAADPACDAAFPSPASELASAMDRLSDHPVETDIEDPWTDEPIVVDDAALAGEIHLLLVTSRGADVPMVVHQAATGDVEPIASLIREASEDPSTSADAMVMFWSMLLLRGLGPLRPGDHGRARGRLLPARAAAGHGTRPGARVQRGARGVGAPRRRRCGSVGRPGPAAQRRRGSTRTRPPTSPTLRTSCRTASRSPSPRSATRSAISDACPTWSPRSSTPGPPRAST